VPALAQATFQIGARSYPSAEWNVFGPMIQGRVVRAHVSNYAGATTGRWLVPYHDGREFTMLSLLNVYRANPAAWEAAEDARHVRVEEDGGWFHSIAGAIGDAIHDVGHVATGLIEAGVQLDEAALHPLTVNSHGLQLSSDAIQLVPDNLQDLAQTITSVAGFGVLAGAAVTAVGGLSVVEDAVSGVSSALGSAQEVLGAVSGFLPAGVTPILPAAAAQPGVFDDATRGFAEGIGPFVLAGFALWLLMRRKS
jgi:hypothetical protein